MCVYVRVRVCVHMADVVIIDGRARGDCSLEVFPYLKPDSLVFIHDWMKDRYVYVSINIRINLYTYIYEYM